MACHCRGRVVPDFIVVMNFMGCDHNDHEVNLRQEIPEGSLPVHNCRLAVSKPQAREVKTRNN